MNNPFASAGPDMVDTFLANIPNIVATGQKCLSMSPGKAVMKLPAQPAWVGDALQQSMHPGCATALADNTCAMAVTSMMDPVMPLATLDLRMDFLRPAASGVNLICEARCIRLSAHVGFAQGLVFQEGLAEPVATVNANMMLGTAGHGRRDIPGVDGVLPQDVLTLPQIIYANDQPALPQDWSPFTEYLGVRRHSRPELAAHAADALFRLPFRQDLVGNPILPAIHGGVVAGFAQTAGILHVSFTNQLPRETPPRAVDFSIDYLRSAKPIDTWARCHTVRQGNRSALVQITLWQDDEKRPVATARAQCLLPPIAR
jgi:uncharacterized protein (TIGR00369 family)